MKKFISLVLALVMVSSVMFAIPVSAAYENTHVNTGNQIEDLIAVATTQIGFKEGNNSSQVSGTVAGSGNYTKYGKWYGINPGAWCAMFVSWCANQAGISSSIIPKHASCDIGMNYFKNQGTWGWGKYWGNYKGYTVYTPKRGDIIYFGNGNLSDSTHVGIVYAVDSSKVYTIEGNTKNVCAYRSYSLNDDYIYGYGIPKYTSGSGSSGGGSTTVTSSISISNATYPTSLSVGSSFNLEGIVTSANPLSWVRGSVYNSAGSIVLDSNNNTSAYSYDVNTKIDSAITFGKLSAGTYVYVIEAEDSAGAYKMLLMQPFTVGSSTQAQHSFQFTVTTNGGTLNIRAGKGTSYDILGSLNNGTSVQVQKIDGSWAYITYNGISGWVSTSYLTKGTIESVEVDFTESAIIDINYSNKTVADSYNLLTFARTLTPTYVTDMSSYGSGETAVNVTAGGQSMKYTGSFTLDTDFTIELYGVFKAGEILNGNYYPIEVNANGTIGAWYYPTGGDSYVVSSASYDLSKSHHIMLVGNVNSLSLYVDGALAATKNITLESTPFIGDAIHIGGNGICASHLIRFRVFNSAATAEEVSAEYKQYNIVTVTPAPTSKPTAVPTAKPTAAPTPVPTQVPFNAANPVVDIDFTVSNTDKKGALTYTRTNSDCPWYTGNIQLTDNFTMELYGSFGEGLLVYNTFYMVEVGNGGSLIESWQVGPNVPYVSYNKFNSNDHHIVITADGTAYSMYIDGVLVAQDSSNDIPDSFSFTAGNEIAIGHGAVSRKLFRLYGTAATASDVVNLYSKVVPANLFETKTSSSYYTDDTTGLLYGISESTSVAEFLSNFKYGSSLSITKNGTAISGNTFVGTGCVVSDGTKSYTIVQLGDINGDGKIAAADYMLIKRHITGAIDFTDAQKGAADCDDNGVVAATDYMKIKAYIKGNFVLYK